MKFDLFVKPEVTLLHATPLEIAEIGARVCYDSFDKAENEDMKNFMKGIKDFSFDDNFESPLVKKVVNAYQHGSISEHVVLNFYCQNFSRGVLQELARHRIASFSVRSTRFTLGDIVAVILLMDSGLISYEEGLQILYGNNNDVKVKRLTVYKSDYFNNKVVKAFVDDAITRLRAMPGLFEHVASKTQQDIVATHANIEESIPTDVVKRFMSANKKNVGDIFKDLVTDSWATEAIFSINLRSFKNFLKLRDSNAAWDPMHDLATAMKDAVPGNYLDVIRK